MKLFRLFIRRITKTTPIPVVDSPVAITKQDSSLEIGIAVEDANKVRNDLAQIDEIVSDIENKIGSGDSRYC